MPALPATVPRGVDRALRQALAKRPLDLPTADAGLAQREEELGAPGVSVKVARVWSRQ